jgi:type II secretory pathway pseudopilin PulG
MKKINNKSFTIAELLIVVAIIMVLVAIAIPILSDKVELSREAYDIHTMRQAASVAVEFAYQGVMNEETAQSVGLKWWYNGGNGTNAAGVYDPWSGRFLPIASKDAKKGYGKGTKRNTKKDYFYMGREMYKSSEDYTNAVVMVAVYPNDHIDVYWKNVKTGNYVGGQVGANDPKYSIRINIK